MSTRNTWLAKFKRTLGGFFPVDKARTGQCRHCGACCCLPVRCWFLKAGTDGKQYCMIYKLRWLNCRKYPRTSSEFITETTCGFCFKTRKEALIEDSPGAQYETEFTEIER
jgi:hypothetical protein